METKPYSLQSPEQIAKDYGGDKQKIAQAMQTGIIDPTAGLLAGMFIDRMRSAAQTEQVPQQTVAQQVFAPAPQAVPVGGLGTTPQAAPPPMAAPAPMPEQAPAPMPEEMPMMADGGLASLPVPDDMFDTESNGDYDGQYAAGGIVAFADGGVSYEDFARVIPIQESRNRYTARNTESGALGKYQLMPDTAKALARRLGLEYRPDLMTVDSEEARRYQDALGNAAMKEAWDYGKGDPSLAATYYHAGPNKAGWGPRTRKYSADILGRLGSGEAQAGTITPERDVDSAEGRIRSFEDTGRMIQQFVGKSPEETEAEDMMRASLREQASPETYEKQRKQDMWQTLAEIGFNMASSKSPYVLQAISEAAAAAMPGVRADRKERAALRDRAISGLLELGARDRKQAMDVLKLQTDIYQTGLSQEQFEKNLGFKEKELQSQENRDALARDAQVEAQRIAAQGRSSDMETYANAVYARLKARNQQGLLKANGQPIRYDDAELQAMAWEQARDAWERIRAAGGRGGKGSSLDAVRSRVAGGGEEDVVNLGSIE